MNKKLKLVFGLMVMLIIAVVATFNLQLNAKSVNLSDLALANIEALAQNEGGNGEGTAKIVISATWEETVYVPISMFVFYECKALYNEVIDCIGEGSLPCSIGNVSVSDLYDCNFCGDPFEWNWGK